MAEEGEQRLDPTTLSDKSVKSPRTSQALQGLQPATAPGASGVLPIENDSRHGMFKVLAGITPGTSTLTTTAITQLRNSVCGDMLTYSRGGDSLGAGCSRDYLETGISYASRSNMAAPSTQQQNNNMMMMLMEQYKETKDLYKQQQNTIEKLTVAVNRMVNRNTGLMSDSSGDSDQEDVNNQFEDVSSDEDGSICDSEPQAKKRKLETPLQTPRGDKNEKLKKLKVVESQFAKNEEYGPAVHDVIASTVNKGLSEPVDHKSQAVQDLMEKYTRPENCEFVDVPKVNKLLWANKDTSRDLKQADKGLQRTQAYITKGMVPLINIINKSLAMESAEAREIFDLSLDAFNLLAYGHQNLSSQRRRLLMPAISSRYSALCNESEKISSPTLLFGEDKDLEKRMKDIDESKKLGHSFSLFSSGKQKRPFKSTQKWSSKDNTRNKRGTADFLGKRAHPQWSTPPQNRAGGRKGSQGPKKSHYRQ